MKSICIRRCATSESIFNISAGHSPSGTIAERRFGLTGRALARLTKSQTMGSAHQPLSLLLLSVLAFVRTVEITIASTKRQ